MKIKKNLPVMIYFLGVLFYLVSFWSQGFVFDQAGNLRAGHENLWADGAAHLTIISTFAYRSLWPSMSPFLINYPFSYPFVADLSSAILVKLGLSIFTAFSLTQIIFTFFSVVALWYFYRLLSKSSHLAILASIIFFTNGGLGFIYYLADSFQAAHPLLALISPSKYYTHLPKLQLDFLNIVHSMLTGQKAFSLGLALSLVILILVYQKFFTSLKEVQKSHLKTGLIILLLGLMPIVHTHCFLALFLILGCWVTGHFYLTKKIDRDWIMIALFTALIALPLIKTFFSQNLTGGFMKIYLGWHAKEHQMNWLYFWFKNWGVVPLLSGLGLWAWIKQNQSQQKKLLIIFSPFGLIFILSNLALWQPNILDNTKLLAFSNLGFALLSAYYFRQVWQKKASSQIGQIIRLILIVSLFGLTILTGSIDVYRVWRTDLHNFVMYTKEELSLADWVKSNTPADSVWLTSDQHNHWLYNLTGRQTLMAYRGWLWTHGYNYAPIEKDIQVMFTHPELSQNLFAKYQVKYVVIGQSEKQQYLIPTSYFAQHFRLIKTSDSTQIYQVE